MAKKKEASITLRYIPFVGIFLLGLLIGIFFQMKKDGEKLSLYTPSQAANQSPEFTHEVTVPELGITLKVPEEIKDIVYIYNGKSAQFSTKSLTKLYKNCGPEDAALGHLSKYNKSDPFPYDGNEQTLKNLTYSRLDQYSNQIVGPIAKEFESLYILYLHPQATCAPVEEKTASELQNAQLHLFKQIIPTVELIK